MATETTTTVGKTTTCRSDRKRVALDVDGVILNYTQCYMNAVRAATNRDIPDGWSPSQWDIDEELGLTAAERKSAYALMALPGVAGSLVPYPGAVEGVKKLADIADVFFVTSPLQVSPTWCYDRTAHLTKLLGKELADNVTYTDHKYTFAADLYVDDKPSNCAEWQAAWPDGKALLWSASYNNGSHVGRLRRTYDWEDVARWALMIPPSRYTPVVRE